MAIRSQATIEAAPAAAPAAADEPPSIYSLYSPVRRTLTIFAVSIGFLLAFANSIYLPALEMVKSELQIGQELLAATVGINLAMLGLASLVSGPASDRFGRVPVYSIACLGYIGSCMGCMFAPNISVLLACRALQGAVVSAFTVTGLGVVADVVPPHIRGRATGATTVAIALSMVASPMIGGVLSRSLGWRSTFAALAILCVVFALALLVFMQRETHQYYVLQRLAKEDPHAASSMREWDAVMTCKPVFDAPWTPFMLILQPDIVPHALVGIVTWAVLSSLINEALPTALAEAPYHLPPEYIGVALLADGLTTIVATPLGGMLSDRYAAGAVLNSPVARLVPNTFIVLLLGPAGTLGAAWALHFRAHLAIVLITVSIAGFGGCFYLPGMFSYISTVKQSAPAAATAGVQSVMAMVAGSVVAVGAVVRTWLGYGWWLTALGLLQLLVCLFAFGVIYRLQAKAVKHMPAWARYSPRLGEED